MTGSLLKAETEGPKADDIRSIEEVSSNCAGSEQKVEFSSELDCSVLKN